MRRFRPLALMLLTLVAAGSRPVATAADLEGTYKLVVIPGPEFEFAILDLGGGGPAEVVDANKQVFQMPPEQARVQDEDDLVVLTLQEKGQPEAATFRGRPAKGKEGQVLGAIRFRGSLYPARLEKTDAKEVAAQPTGMEMQTKLVGAMRQESPQKVVEALKQFAHENASHPVAANAYQQIFALAERVKLTPEQARTLLEEWVEGARTYGDEWAAEVQTKAMKALPKTKEFAPLLLDLASRADKALGEKAPASQKAEVVGLLARAADLAGKPDIAAEARARAETLEAQLDEEYHATVPPFKPEPFAGRKDGQDRVVLMELFTGAQCPPCVAADVGFDALLKTYKPTEMIGLQYHLHIPGPDPLTNTASEARQSYYGDEIGGTPSTFFNGQSLAGGGGGMARAKVKYDEFRTIIDERLEEKRKASIDLKVAPDGAKGFKITATARTEGSPKDAKPKLRLALTEESIRYVGGNQLRFHHHVVRAMPGGPEGKELADGQAQVELTVNLDDVRREIEEYVSSFEKTRGGFPNPVPAVELSDLSVVAFVQDDTDRSVWHAISVPVSGGEPKSE